MGLHGIHHQQKDAQRALCLYVRRLAGDESAALFLARRNLRLGRGDRTGAARIATVIFVAHVVSWLFSSRHVAARGEIFNYLTAVSAALYMAAYVYLGYLAIEPYVRRRWPKMLVSWTRVLGGKLTDARVGRDLLAGCLAGLFVVTLIQVAAALPNWFNLPGQTPFSPLYESLLLRGWGGACSRAVTVLGLVLIYSLALRPSPWP